MKAAGTIPSPSASRGISLLEIVISIGILGAVLAAVGHIINQGADYAVRTELASEGVLRCESTLAEVVAGVIPKDSSGKTSYSDNPDWTWEVTVSPGTRDDIEIVEVTVRHQRNEVIDQVTKLSRWMRTDEALLSSSGGTDETGL